MKPAERVALLWLAGGLLAFAAAVPWRRPHQLANYTTSLDGRTPNQRTNAVLAAEAINGTIVPAGGTFSFNETVGPWTRRRGYRRAPVSYGGEMLMAYGGGVCQVSSTLYNAALLAGMRITARDHHLWEPQYVEAGRDAAVAPQVADLAFTNPLPAPVRVVATADGDRLTVRLRSTASPPAHYRIDVDRLGTTTGSPIVRYQAGGDTAVRAGRPGRHVRAWRVAVRRDGRVSRELLSDDSYRALPALISVGD